MSHARALVWALLLAACGSEPPLVAIEVSQQPNTAPIPGLERLRLIVQPCGTDTAAISSNVAVRSSVPERVEAPLSPGASFYVWLQGWLACNPPCQALADAPTGSCVCIDDGQSAPAQRLSLEACTDWITAQSSMTVKLILGEPAGLCPPSAKPSCPAP